MLKMVLVFKLLDIYSSVRRIGVFADAVILGLSHEMRLQLKNKLLAGERPVSLELNRWEYVWTGGRGAILLNISQPQK